MAEFRVNLWVTSSEERKADVKADSIQEVFDNFDEMIDDFWEETQDVGHYGDTDWHITSVENLATGESVGAPRQPTEYYLATLSTRNFDFTAFGNTEDEARAALQEGWRKHCRQAVASDPGGPPLFMWEDIADDVNYHRIVPGQCLRDGEPLSTIPF